MNANTRASSAQVRERVSPQRSRPSSFAPRPDHRYSTAGELEADLAALPLGAKSAQPARAAAATAALVLLLAIGAWEAVGRLAGFSTPSGFLLSAGNWNRPTADLDQAAHPVIAVLPFKNLSTESDSEYFVDGLTGEIIRNLAVIEGLQVRSLTSAFVFKDTPRNLRDVGRQLAANLVVEGSVLRLGNRLRINAQMVRLPDDVPLWSERFDRELEDVFSIQDEISRAIVNRLRLTLGKGQRRYHTSVAAYELYLRGRTLVSRRGNPGLEEAANLFQQAVARDPAFAPAHAGLANAYALMSEPTSSNLSYQAAHSVLRPSALRAYELDPLIADAWAAMGWLHARECEWTNSEAAFKKAIELNPSFTQAYTSYSIAALQPLRKFDDALRVLQAALRNDPLSLDVQREIALVYLSTERYDEAVSVLQHVTTVDPDFPFGKTHLGRALTYSGRPEEALPLLEGLDGRHLGRYKPQARRGPWLAQAYVRIGRLAETLLVEHRGSPTSLAVIYAALGAKDRAIEVCKKSLPRSRTTSDGF